MKDYQREFFDFAIECQALRFGEFTLKSGRISPYFFNTGLFNTGKRLARLGQFYARAILDSGLPFDMLYGPAYKGIPLVCATAIAFAEPQGRDAHGRASAAQDRMSGVADVPYAFNRKEAKRHGEGGIIVGAPLAGKVLVIDDVISAGISVRESVQIIRQAGATPAGVAIAIDRQERGEGATSAVQEVEMSFGIRVISIAGLSDLLSYLEGKDGGRRYLDAINTYRRQYGT